MIDDRLMPRKVPDLRRLVEYMPPRERGLEREHGLEPLSEVATQLRAMPYGPFVEFARDINANPDKLWSWACGRN